MLEFQGDDVSRGGEGGEARFVVPGRLAVLRGDLRRDAFAVGGIDMRAIAELRRRDGEHPAELAAAQNADGRSRSEQTVSPRERSEEHTSELQSLMRISYAVFCLKKKKDKT